MEMRPELCNFRGEYWTISALEAVKKIHAIYWPPLGEPKMLTYNYVFFYFRKCASTLKSIILESLFHI